MVGGMDRAQGEAQCWLWASSGPPALPLCLAHIRQREHHVQSLLEL